MPATIRWTEDRDRDARVEIVRRAWHRAYSEIFTPAEIDGVFDGSVPLRGDWTDRRSGPAGTLVAEVHETVAGIASLGVLEPEVGEVAGFYVDPSHQGSGIGRQLWEASQAVFAHRGFERFEVFTLAAAAARGFYERMGCERLGDAALTVGGHRAAVIRYGGKVHRMPGEPAT